MIRLLVDVGGTALKAQALKPGEHPDGAPMSFPARSSLPKDDLIAHLCGVLNELAGAETEAEIAMAFPGPFDYDKGIPYMEGLAKYGALWGVHLPSALSPGLSFTASWRFINDVSAFALGAARAVAPKGRVMAVCLGTGAGSAFLIDGQLCVDESEGVPSNGWIYPLPFEGQRIDDALSARGLTALAANTPLEGLDPKALSEAAYQGDEAALSLWSRFGERVGVALGPIAARFQADVLLLGGQISKSASLFDAALRKNGSVRVVTLPETSHYTFLGLETLFEAPGED